MGNVGGEEGQDAWGGPGKGEQREEKKRGREESARLNGWIERQEKLQGGLEDLLAIVMLGFRELQYVPVLKYYVIIIWVKTSHACV